MCIYGDADLPEREQQQQWQQHHQPMIICVCTMCLFRYMMVCSRERAIDRRVYVCLGTFSIRWMKKIQIVIFCHIQQYISIAIRYFLRLGGSHIRFDSIVHPPRIRNPHSHFVRYGHGVIEDGISFFSALRCLRRYIIKIVILCNLCDTVVVHTSSFTSSVCDDKTILLQICFRTAVWILDLNICFAFYSSQFFFSSLFSYAHTSEWNEFLCRVFFSFVSVVSFMI